MANQPQKSHKPWIDELVRRTEANNSTAALSILAHHALGMYDVWLVQKILREKGLFERFDGWFKKAVEEQP